MPVNIADLTADYRFHARMLHDGDLPAQKKWLVQQYMTEAEAIRAGHHKAGGR